MSVTVLENIAVNIKAAIAEITTVNGFNQTLIPVRPKRVDFRTPWNDLTVLVNQVEAEDLDSPAMARDRLQYFLLVIFCIDSDEATITIDTRLNAIFGDVLKKLMEDPQRGTLAIDTDIHESTAFDDDEGRTSGIAIKISVHYRTKYDDPFTQM